MTLADLLPENHNYIVFTKKPLIFPLYLGEKTFFPIVFIPCVSPLLLLRNTSLLTFLMSK